MSSFQRLRSIGILLAVVVSALPSAGLPSPAAVRAGAISEDLLGGIRFREIGPAVLGGRVSAVSVSQGEPQVAYIAAASGGVWRSNDLGDTWLPVFDDFGVSSIGAVSVAPSDSDVVWIGSGEANARQNVGWGNGVYVSVDSGKNWRHAGLEQSRHIGRIAVHPRKPHEALVAALGPMWRSGGQRGLFLSEDTGHSWRQVLKVDNQTGVIDVAYAFKNPCLVYATTLRTAMPTIGGTGQLRWPMDGDTNGIYRSLDCGRHWVRINNGFPMKDIGRIAIDIYRQDPAIAIAIVEGDKGGIYRTDDGGDTWRLMNKEVRSTAYISHIRIDPNDHQRIWVGGADPLYFSADGGETFCASEDGNGPTYCSNWLERIHFDTHAIWIDPENSSHMLIGNDGGIYRSFSGGRTWDYINSLSLAQFHQINYDLERPYNVYGGTQDSGTWVGPSNSLHVAGILNADWIGLLVGDGYFVEPKAGEKRDVFAEYQGGRLFRVDQSTGERKDIRPASMQPDTSYRFASGNHPVIVSPHDENTVLFGGNRLFISNDRGETWRDTPDLTLSASGPGTISAIDESSRVRGLLWIGTSDGVVQLSRDNGRNWANLSDRLPVEPGMYVTRVVASAALEGRAYVTLAGHWRGDEEPYVMVTEDFGDTWRRIDSTLPSGAVPHVIREHPDNPDFLILGTERGLWMTWDRGDYWSSVSLGLPSARIHDVRIHRRDDDLIIGTHGRGMYILDDIGAIARLDSDAAASKLTLYDPRVAYMYRMSNHMNNLGLGHREYIAQNPPAGAIIDYFIGEQHASGGSATIAIKGPGGDLVRSLSGSMQKGLNRVVWDLRHETMYKPPLGISSTPPGQPGGPRMRALALSQGPLVLPDEYSVTIVAGKEVAATQLTVLEDPRLDVDRDNLIAQRAAWHRLTKLWVQGNAMVGELNKLRPAISSLQNELADVSSADELQLKTERLLERLESKWHELAPEPQRKSLYRDFLDPGTRLTQDGPLVARIGQVLLSVSQSSTMPTEVQKFQIQAFADELQEYIDQWDTSVVEPVEVLNEYLSEANLPQLSPPASIGSIQ